jgi:diguanylate cyclase (GGDEF)-like protein
MLDQLPDYLERDCDDGANEALLVIDPASGRLSHANRSAAELFALGDDALATTRASEVLPAFADLTPRSFEARVAHGSRERRVAVRLERLHGGPFPRSAALLASIRALDDDAAQAPAVVAGPRRLERLESLWRLVVRRGFAGTEQVRALLHEGASGMGLERATLARLDGEDLVVEFAWPEDEAGGRIPLERSLSRAALTRSGTFAALDTRADSELRRIANDVRSFLTSAFRVGEARYVLTFSSVAARLKPFDDDDWQYVENLVEALARGIERRERDTRIEKLAYSDALTSLPNRLAVLGRLDDALAEAERSGGRAAVLFLDIDGFKDVNTAIGHRGGDAVLSEVAQRLRGTLRAEEYIGRLGGDEFAVVMPQVADREAIESIAQRIESVLSFPFAVRDDRFSLSASIGVAVYPDDASGRDDLLACADAAMYAAKDEGGSRLRFRASNGVFTNRALGPVPVLTGERRDPAYLLCFQPILDLRTGRVTAAEALIRRMHPEHGLLAPERGWSLARDEEGRRLLDRWVLREAAAQARHWQQAGMPLRIDVNLAAFDPRDVDELLVDAALAADVRRLRVEIAAEQIADPERQEQLAAFVEHCASSGIGFALDGFDGGYGVIAALSNLPIDAVKLDRPLVESVMASRTSRAVVQGTILVAKSLGWRVIGKGVETVAQRDGLLALECDEIQGFFVARPMTAADFEAWFAARDRLDRDG